MKDSQKIKIGFFGTPDLSLHFLEYLFNNEFEISFVVTQPPSKSGRGKLLKKSSVHLWEEKKHIKVFYPENTKNKKFIECICSKKADFLVVVAYGKLIPIKILDSPKYMAVNVHASLLPRWRGAAPIQRAVLNGDIKTGVTIMKMIQELDAGPIIFMRSFDIKKYDTSGTIYQKIIDHGKTLLIEALNKIVGNDYKLQYQNVKDVTYASKIKKIESKINWSEDAKNIFFKTKAFNPYPGAWTFLDGKKRIKILQTEYLGETKYLNNLNLKIGQSTDKLEVKCGAGYLKISLLQKEGRKPISAKEFINGIKLNDIWFT